MKNLTSAILAIGLLMSSDGCATLNGPPDPKWSVLAKVVSRRGTYEAVKTHPELRQAFEVAVSAMDNLLIQTEVNVAELTAALRKLPVDELRSDEGALMVQDAIDLYDGLVGDVLRLKEGTQIRAIGVAIRDGVLGGLSMSSGDGG